MCEVSPAVIMVACRTVQHSPMFRARPLLLPDRDGRAPSRSGVPMAEPASHLQPGRLAHRGVSGRRPWLRVPGGAAWIVDDVAMGHRSSASPFRIKLRARPRAQMTAGCQLACFRCSSSWPPARSRQGAKSPVFPRHTGVLGARTTPRRMAGVLPARRQPIQLLASLRRPSSPGTESAGPGDGRGRGGLVPER